jgi:anaerobic ribonucleoside-triphosphate reductase activating protein
MIRAISQLEKPASSATEADLINIAAVCPATRSLGPGLRAAVWVQGCPFRCPGCIAPDWQPNRPANLLRPADLVDSLLLDTRVTGLTFSGGEPMQQAASLARVARLARAARRDLTVICFTGFSLDHLRKTPPFPGVHDLLGEVDVLIDGPFIARLNDNRGLRGSSNQRIHYLSGRLLHVDFAALPRSAEVHLMDGQVMMVGVPPVHVPEAFNRAVDLARSQFGKQVRYERP